VLPAVVGGVFAVSCSRYGAWTCCWPWRQTVAAHQRGECQQLGCCSLRVTALTGVLFGLFPALHAAREWERHAQGRHARLSGGVAKLTRAQHARDREMALAVVLLVGAGL
jgi:hypothetical protein